MNSQRIGGYSMIDPSSLNAGLHYRYMGRASGGYVSGGPPTYIHAPEQVMSSGEWRAALAAFRQRQHIRRLLGFPVGLTDVREPAWVVQTRQQMVEAWGSGNGRLE
jgi:hypothetical protein